MGGTGLNGFMIGGAILALAGVLALAVPVFTTHDTKDVAKLGDLKIQTTEAQHYAIPPLAAGGALALGIVLIGVGLSRRR